MVNRPSLKFLILLLRKSLYPDLVMQSTHSAEGIGNDDRQKAYDADKANYMAININDENRHFKKLSSLIYLN